MGNIGKCIDIINVQQNIPKQNRVYCCYAEASLVTDFSLRSLWATHFASFPILHPNLNKFVLSYGIRNY